MAKLANAQMRSATAKIFLADKRKEEKSFCFRSLQTSLEESCAKISIREIGLMSKHSLECNAIAEKPKMLMPLSGDIKLTTKSGEQILKPGKSIILTEDFKVVNDFKDNPIHWLEIAWIGNGTPCQTDLSFLSLKNQMHSLLTENDSIQAYIGRYDSRVDGCLVIPDNRETFVFIVGGVFEVQDRLLRERDGLLLKGISELGFEGLAAEGLVLIFIL